LNSTSAARSPPPGPRNQLGQATIPVRADHQIDLRHTLEQLWGRGVARSPRQQRVLDAWSSLKRYKRPGAVLSRWWLLWRNALGPKLLERVPQVDLVIGPDGYRGLPELIARARGGERAAGRRVQRMEHYEDVPPVRDNSISAFVTVATWLRLSVHLLHSFR